MKNNIYFDCSSTIKPYEETLRTFYDISVNHFANASSNHNLGFQCTAVLEKARAQIAKYLKVLPEEVIFTSGASEGNNFAIKGVAYHNKSWATRLITTKAEHPSVMQVFKHLEQEGFDVVYLNYDKEGNLDFNQLKEALKVPTSLVSVMGVNNEVGFIFDNHKVYQIVKENSRAIVHVDATQTLGKEYISPNDYDILTFSGHKIGGIKGSGAMIKKKKVELDSLILGGEQEHGMRAGTVPLGLDCSLATALRISLTTQEKRRHNVIQLNQYLRQELSQIEEIEITSKGNSTPFILSFALKKHKGSVIAEALSNEGIYVSTKSACSSREAGYSYVLKNAGYDDQIANNGIRLSFSGYETLEEGKIFIQTLKEILNTIKVKEN